MDSSMIFLRFSTKVVKFPTPNTSSWEILLTEDLTQLKPSNFFFVLRWSTQLILLSLEVITRLDKLPPFMDSTMKLLESMESPQKLGFGQKIGKE